MSTNPPKLYVGCALTDASEVFKQSVEQFKESLRKEGFEVFNFTGLMDGDPLKVYNWDIGHCVKNCDAFVAICDYPSLGLGYELNEAVRLKKPVLAIAQTDSKVTRLLLGAAEAEPNLQFERYKKLNSSETIEQIANWLAPLVKK
jgi:nucleoside 2-deoxyribosyltransferase